MEKKNSSRLTERNQRWNMVQTIYVREDVSFCVSVWKMHVWFQMEWIAWAIKCAWYKSTYEECFANIRWMFWNRVITCFAYFKTKKKFNMCVCVCAHCVSKRVRRANGMPAICMQLLWTFYTHFQAHTCQGKKRNEPFWISFSNQNNLNWNCAQILIFSNCFITVEISTMYIKKIQ